MMDDQQLQQLFDNFAPPIAEDSTFMDRLEHNLNAVEAVRVEQRQQRARTRRAIVCAALAGFGTGVALTLAMPYLPQMLQALGTDMWVARSRTLSILGYAASMAVAIVAALATYDITLTVATLRAPNPTTAHF